jgi:hypothetical protein
MPAAPPVESLAKPEAFREIKGHSAEIAHKLGNGDRCFYLDRMRRPPLHRAAIWVWIDAWRFTRASSATGFWRRE